MRDVTLLSMKNKSVQNCRFVHHAKFHCIMTTLNKLFKIEFERWGELEKSQQLFFLPPPPTYHKHQFYGLRGGSTRLIMRTKYVCHGLISLHVNFHDKHLGDVNSNLKYKYLQVGGKRKKSPKNALKVPKKAENCVKIGSL